MWHVNFHAQLILKENKHSQAPNGNCIGSAKKNKFLRLSLNSVIGRTNNVVFKNGRARKPIIACIILRKPHISRSRENSLWTLETSKSNKNYQHSKTWLKYYPSNKRQNVLHLLLPEVYSKYTAVWLAKMHLRLIISLADKSSIRLSSFYQTFTVNQSFHHPF